MCEFCGRMLRGIDCRTTALLRHVTWSGIPSTDDSTYTLSRVTARILRGILPWLVNNPDQSDIWFETPKLNRNRITIRGLRHTQSGQGCLPPASSCLTYCNRKRNYWCTNHHQSFRWLWTSHALLRQGSACMDGNPAQCSVWSRTSINGIILFHTRTVRRRYVVCSDRRSRWLVWSVAMRFESDAGAMHARKVHAVPATGIEKIWSEMRLNTWKLLA